ncbi:MAG: ribonuclease III [Cyanobacteria bacterium P01_G01_bin.54]
MVYPHQRQQQLHTLIQRLGLPEDAPVNWQLLEHALTHPNVNARTNYEKLEFVGDAVIRLLASEVLLQDDPDAPVGDYAAIRSIVVSDRVLARWGERYGLERYLLTAQSSSKNSGQHLGHRPNPYVRLADVFEAVLGALYRSTRDMSLIEPWLTPLLQQTAAEVRADPAFYNYKDALQDWTQRQHRLLPTYRVHEQAAVDPQIRFHAEVWLQDTALGQGSGPTKKAAEQAAAKMAFFAVVQPERGEGGRDKGDGDKGKS